VTAGRLDTAEAALRSRASAIVADVAERLADPAAVAAFQRESAGHFYALSLADGYPALALLYAELGHTEPAYRRTAHDHRPALAHVVGRRRRPRRRAAPPQRPLHGMSPRGSGAM